MIEKYIKIPFFFLVVIITAVGVNGVSIPPPRKRVSFRPKKENGQKMKYVPV